MGWCEPRVGLGLGTGDTAVSGGFGCAPGQRVRLSGTRGNARPKPPGWLGDGGRRPKARSRRPRGALSRRTTLPSLFISSLWLGRVDLTV